MTPTPTLATPFTDDVTTPAGAHDLGPEYVTAVGKVVASHVRNELAGATVFDEPAIAMAPGPREKWLACRIAMEEYGHHLKFNRLARELDLDDPLSGRTLSVFEYELSSWTEFVVLKAIVDLAEVILMEDLLTATYVPLRALATRLLPEEVFHVSFGKSSTRALLGESGDVEAVQRAVDDLVPFTLPFFGRSVSANNDLFRRWGIKRATNDELRRQFIERSRMFVEGELDLSYPDVDVTWNG